ncbi:RagB/SusD family nutrient uptake outer membrane protein [Flavivirga algicola]|uniref:RagB/SusD family nutrient uptake outer membrane protein n=1 Tax=Flavivirga algicola TaxID=2729136 RepID=A0ABX1RR41_9FLAO|nr:RagB/SusD family nutrient uptake outer membrane protein [Flavivirga algicola]NMH86025.1 RagB/SusD family nutrient uptake outer membrane protein [Flavivirga algicola]
MKKIKYLFILMFVTFLSCDEDILELTDKNGLNSDNFMQTESQAIDATTAAYDPLNHLGMYKLTFLTLGEIPTDNIINENGDGNFGPDMIKLNSYNWDSNNLYFNVRWNAGYKGIARANFVLGNLDKVTNFSSGKRDELEGQALFLRALYYYNLVAGFGDIPLVTTLLTPAELNTIEKSPEADVWAQMEEDLTRAAQLLPASYPSDQVGRATSGAAYGLLSRVKLWTQDYQGAENAASQVESLGYQLVAAEDFVKLFDGRMENSSESVFEVQLIPGRGNFWNDEKAETSLIMHIFPRISWAVYMIPRQTATYDVVAEAFEPNDIRREASILISGQDQIYYASVDQTSVFPDLSIHNDFRLDLQVDGAYQMRKFLPYDTTNWQRGGAFFNQGTSINIPVIRYSEVILNKAEALVLQGKTAEAWNELEKIRLRAGLSMAGISNSDQAALLEQIKKDRRSELMFEGHRWFDLKRWGDLGDLTSAGLNYGGQTNWLIPQPEKDVNPNL